MGSSGEDVQLSPKAREIIPFSIECKNTEKLNIWGAIEQANVNATKKKSNYLVVFRRNRTKANVIMEYDVFLKLLQESYEYRKIKGIN